MIRHLLGGLKAHLSRGKSLFALSLFGVALGVAAVLSIQILHASSVGAFEGTLRAVGGDADLFVTGAAPTLPETALPAVLGDPHVARATPSLQVDVALVGEDGFFLDLVGFDFLAAVDLPWDRPPAEAGDPLFEPGWCAVSPELAARFGWEVGDRFRVSSGSRTIDLRVGALVDFRRITPLAGTRLVVTDIAQAQHATGLAGRVDRIDVVLREGADPESARRSIEARLGPGFRAVTPRERRDEAVGLMGAFRLNLTALSLVSVVVGAFLVHSATRAALVRRRAEFGLLRALGATRGQVAGLILAEAALLGGLGTAAGIPLGIFAARANLDVVSSTVTNLYLLQEVERAVVPPALWLLAAAVGLGGALLGALGPALDMSRREPRALLGSFSLHERIGSAAAPLAAVAAGLLALAGAVHALAPAGWRPAGFVSGVLLLVALPLASPLAIVLAARLLHPRRFGLRWGVHTLGARLQTTAVAVAAVAVTASMLIGITIMIGSFRRTVEVWIDGTLVADVYVTSDSWRRARGDAWLDPALVDAIAARDSVERVYRLRQYRVYSDGRRIALGGSDLAADPELGALELLEGDPREALRRVAEDGAVVVTEPLARKAGLGAGDVLPVDTPGGRIELPVAGVAYDYSSEAGGALMDLDAFEKLFGPGPVSNLALFLAPGVDPEDEVRRLRERFSDLPLEIRSNRTIREEVFRIFDQTFAITRILQAIALLIAVAGIALTLIVLARERVAELALYRALGATRAQILRVFLGKGLGLATLGLGLGAIGGLALAAVLIWRINRDAFGWTIAVHWPVAALVEQVATILAAGAAASFYPALRAGRTPATELSREDL